MKPRLSDWFAHVWRSSRERRAVRNLSASCGLGLLFLAWAGLPPSWLGALPPRPVPTTFWARPLRLEPGIDPARLGLADQLRRLGYRESETPELQPGRFWAKGRKILIERRRFEDAGRPSAGGRVRIDLGRYGLIRHIRDGEGRRLAYAELEPERIGRHFADEPRAQAPVALARMPDHLVGAVLTLEDQRFYEHDGLDVRRIGGAFMANLRAGRVVQGGSTITQQLVKNVFLSQERTLWRKLREARLARQLEGQLSKPEILEAYLNEVYLGQDGSVEIHGVSAASWHYFAQPVEELTLAQSALLAGLIRGPSLYRPFEHPERARLRRDQVLAQLTAEGEISAEVAAAASSEPLELRHGRSEIPSARYFLDLMRPALLAQLEPQVLDGGALSVHTSLDARLQRAAERSVREGLAGLEKLHPRLRDDAAPLQAALVALDAETGDVLALVGGREHARFPFNRAVTARRQPGSAFKPIVALAALARDGGASPTHTLASLLDDEPLELETREGTWTPQNHDHEYRGQVTLRAAIEQSLNVPMARLALDIGPQRIVRAARRVGVESRLHPVPSLALGTYEVSLLELTRAYATLAAGGLRPELRPVHSVYDLERHQRLRVDPASERVYRRDEAYLVTSALRGVVQRGTGRGLGARGYVAPVAGKTGTTNGYRDGWFLGYTTDLVVGVWVGFDDGRGMGLSGGRTSLPIFARFLREASAGSIPGDFQPPRGLIEAKVDPRSGLLADSFCAGEPELFLRGTEPTERCAGNFWRRRRPHQYFEQYSSDAAERPSDIRARALALEAAFQRTFGRRRR